MSEHTKSNPHQIIENIRKKNFLLDIENESATVRAGALNLQQQLNNALKLLSSDLYSKKSHFVLEIVQNADDNAYTAGSTPELVFVVSSDRMVVVNNELGFSQENVIAICSVGASSKSKDKTGYIGEKGIGFKSVFTVSDAPEIHSNGYHFRFDRTSEANLLGYVVPNWCPPSVPVRSDATTIILPAKPGHAFDNSTLAELDARLLLFLNKLRQLTLEHQGSTVVYARKEMGCFSQLTSTTTASDGTITTQKLHYFRVSRTFAIDVQARDEKREGITQSTVVLAFPINDKGAALPEPHSSVFAFLPIRPMGFQFPIQADFILSSSREELLTDRPWNRFLCESIADTFVGSVEQFKAVETLGLSYLRFVPAEGEVTDPFFRPLRAAILRRLASTACLRSASGNWKKPSELRDASSSFRALFPNAVATELLGFDYIDPSMEGGAPLLRELGVRDLSTHDVVAIFKLHGEWLCVQPLEWKAKFYAYIADSHVNLIKAGLLKAACLPLADGALAVPDKTQAFFPLRRGKKYGFEHELIIIDRRLYEAAAELSVNVVSLFSAMGVRADRPYDLVHSHILPRHAGIAWMSSDHAAVIGHLRYIKDKLATFLEGAAAVGKSRADAIGELREGLWVGTKAQNASVWRFNRVGALYLAREYQAPFCIESLLSEPIEAESYVSPAYLDAKAPDAQEQAASWREFLWLLGVRQSPALKQIGPNWACSDELAALLRSPQTAARRATLESLSQHWETYAHCVTYIAQQGRSRTSFVDSHFIQVLRASTAPIKGRAVVALSASYYPSAEIKALLGESLPYVEAALVPAMLDACGITHRVDAQALIKRLRQLKQSASTSQKQVQSIYRVLDERFWDLDSRAIRDAFDAEPLILVKGDPKRWLRPSALTWQTSRPFLETRYPSIQSQYRDFSRFFLNRLQVSRELPIERWVEALEHIDDIDDVDARQAEALAIYRKVNNELKPRFGREVELPDWISTFQHDEVFINQRGERVANDPQLMVNDAPEFGDLFLEEETLSFVAVPLVDIPRLRRLFEAAEVARVSDAVIVELLDDTQDELDASLTTRVRRAYPYIARILYTTHPDVFDSALQNGALHAIRSLSVHAAPVVRLQVCLGEHLRETTVDAAISDGRFVYRTGASSIKDRLAIELSKSLGAPPESADAFARLLLEEDPRSIEEFLGVRRVGVLPTDLLIAINHLGSAPNTSPVAGDESNWNPDATSDLHEDIEPEHGGETAAASELSDGPTSRTPDVESHAAPQTQRLEETSSKADAQHESPLASAQTEAADREANNADASAHAPGKGLLSPILSATPSTPSDDGDRVRPFSAPGRTTAPSAESGAHNTGFYNGRSPTATAGPVAPLVGGASTHTSNGTQASVSSGISPIAPASGALAAPSSPRTRSGRLLSYVQTADGSTAVRSPEDPALAAARDATGRAAVAHFLKTQASRWALLTEMPHNNPGFDILATSLDGQEAYIEVKGQSGAWTQEGVALTPRELIKAHEQRQHYWLCIVEHVHDEQRRQMHLVQDPFGLADQFRFDVGWKDVAEQLSSAPTRPEKDLYVLLPDDGPGRIMSVRARGQFFNLHVTLRGGRQVNTVFNPARMPLSKEPLWQE